MGEDVSHWSNSDGHTEQGNEENAKAKRDFAIMMGEGTVDTAERQKNILTLTCCQTC